MLGLLVCDIGIFQIFVRHTNVGMACLVASHDDALGIGQISDAGILKTVELVRIRPTQCLPNLCPLKAELVHINFFGTGNEFVSE